MKGSDIMFKSITQVFFSSPRPSGRDSRSPRSRAREQRRSAYALEGQIKEYCKSEYEIYVDTCSLLSDDGMELLDIIGRVFPGYRKRLNVFDSVLKELERVSGREGSRALNAERALGKLRQLERSGLVRVMIGRNSHYSDVNFISEFTVLCGEKDALLITQDKDLANKIKKLPEFVGEVVRNKHDCDVRRIGKSMRLEPFTPERRSADPERSANIRFNTVYGR